MSDRIIPPPPRYRVTCESIERLRELGASEHVILYAEWALRREEDEDRWRRWFLRRLRNLRPFPRG